MSLFSAPKIEAPKEDPAVAAARQRQQDQADTALSLSIQDDLRRKMQARLQSFGLVPTPATATAGARPAVTTGFMTAI
jgi:hypothetical protein